MAVVRRSHEHTTISGGVPQLCPAHGPYPPSDLAAMSAPAAMSNSTTRAWPWHTAIVSAVTLQHSRLQHPTARCRFVSALPGVARGCQLLDVGAGRDEQLDHARVSITRCQHECSPPATELAGAPDGCQRLRSALPILGGDVNAGGNELLDWARVPSSRRLRERSPPSPGKRH